jgi:hypothetical protein
VKWFLIWLLLTGTYLLGLLFSWPFAGSGEITAETLVHLAVIPAVQIVALWVVSYVRGQRKKPHLPNPPLPSPPHPPREEGDFRSRGEGAPSPGGRGGDGRGSG